MFGHTFYHKTLRKNVILFGTLFNDIFITRDDSSGVEVQTVKVPITYGPKEKTLSRVVADPSLTRPVAVILPRMSFEMTSLQYDPQRKLPTVNKFRVKATTTGDDPATQNRYVYNPVPYNIGFSLNIMVRNAEDGTRIVEQILPYFSPEWTATVQLIPEINLALDIPTIINNVTVQDNYEGAADERRIIIWTLDFTMKTYLFGPITRSGIITLANTNFYSTTDITSLPEESVTVYPGQLANGTATTNSSLTVDRSTIASNTDWDYVITRSSV
jgi:hypothetical protein